MGTPLSADTDPAAEQVQLAVLSRMPPWRKLQAVADANRAARLLCICGLRQRHPQDSDEALTLRLFELVLGEDLAQRVAAWRERPR